MGSLSVRKLDDDTLRKLRVRAAQHGVSMEEEVRRIIKQAVSSPERLGDFAVGLFSAAYGGEELELPARRSSSPMGLRSSRVRSFLWSQRLALPHSSSSAAPKIAAASSARQNTGLSMTMPPLIASKLLMSKVDKG